MARDNGALSEGASGWEALLAVASDWSEQGETIVLLRHSIREPIREPSIDAALSAPLTDEGRALARAFGARLPAHLEARLLSSPVARCVDTAERIAEGLRAEDGTASYLGKRRFLSGDFVRDPKPVLRAFVGSGTTGFLKAWHDGLFPEEVVLSPERAGRDLLENLLAERSSADVPHIDLHVAHDLTVAALAGLAFDVTDERFSWPGYMEGCVLQPGAGDVRLWYDGAEGVIPRA